MKTDHNIDQLFRQGLNDPDIPFNEMDWKDMEQKLDAQKNKSKMILWRSVAAGIAAVILVVLFWVLSKPVQISVDSIKAGQTIETVKSKTADKSSLSIPVPLQVKPETKSFAFKPTREVRFSDTSWKEIKAGQKDKDTVSQMAVLHHEIFKSGEGTDVEKEKTAVLAHRSSSASNADRDEVLKSIRKKMEASLGQSNALTLSVMAAPDISTAKQSMSSKISTNVGILASYGLNRRFSLTSGAIYSRKFYNSGGVAPQSNTYNAGGAWQVNADCNVLDIPLNVNYKVLDKRNFSVSLNTGLSSYFMLKEKYTFITGNAGPTQQISNLEINNQNQHLFGIANLSVNFERRISEGITVGIQPFVKLPLTGIGYGNADLRSTGVSFSLNLGLFPIKKPSGYASNLRLK